MQFYFLIHHNFCCCCPDFSLCLGDVMSLFCRILFTPFPWHVEKVKTPLCDTESPDLFADRVHHANLSTYAPAKLPASVPNYKLGQIYKTWLFQSSLLKPFSLVSDSFYSPSSQILSLRNTATLSRLSSSTDLANLP